MTLPVVTAEYVAALAELGAAVLEEREKRAAILPAADAAKAASESSVGYDVWLPKRDEELRLRAAWRAAIVRVEKAGDRLQKAATEAIWHREVERGKAMLAPLPAKYRPKKRGKRK